MGKYNSSTFRVTPLVNAIKANQANFDKFIQSVITTRIIPSLQCPTVDDAYFYGDNEKKLKPPKQHLIDLVKYFASKQNHSSIVSGKDRSALFGLCGEDQQRMAESKAIRLVQNTYEAPVLPKAWYILEGPSNPDIYIEGDDYVLICEGKWTESHITITTTHLKAPGESRNQMIRHIQGALNATTKKVYAFYIVDKYCQYQNDLTEAAFEQQLEAETIKPLEKDDILSSFYGYATWQDLEEAINGLVFLTKEQIDRLP